MANNTVDWSDGYATVTHYNAQGKGGGAFGANYGAGLPGLDSHGINFGVAYSAVAFKTENSLALRRGLCDDGIVAPKTWPMKHLFPTTVDGQEICFELSPVKEANVTDSNIKVKVKVTEQCGGNCEKCGEANECNTKVTEDGCEVTPTTDTPVGCRLEAKNRCPAAQECGVAFDQHLKKVGYNAKWQKTCTPRGGGYNDWCGGVYPHFDLGDSDDLKGIKALCSRDAGSGNNPDNCVVKMSRIACPA